jgi:hypothetical protein
MRYAFALFAVLLAIMPAAGATAARPFTEDQVPAPLKPWLPWVLHDIEHDSCPFFYDRVSEHVCSWPTLLTLGIDAKGGTFTYQFTVYDTPDKKPVRILLPGTRETWPQDVKIDRQPAIVLSFEERPSLLLSEGTYTVTGNFAWDTMPVAMRVPAAMGLVHLSVGGKDVAIPDIEGDQVWIQRTTDQGQSAEENRLEAKIFRKVTDGIPLLMDTYVRLEVSGKQREEALGKVLPEGFIPIGVQSDLPARLEPDGTLRMQLRPGTWQININARYPGPVETLKLPPRNGILSEQEVWSFEPMNQLRLTQVEGVDAIDPSQTELPQEWRRFPAYLMKPGSRFTLSEKRRGATDTVPDQLNLSRDIWLDFNGKGFTFEDTVSGAIRQSTRLEASDGVELGDATINGKNQYITRIDPKSNPGVEVREGAINLQAGSRIESGKPRFSATGWKSSFDHVSAQLFLPPGWSLFTYSGVDSVSSSWVSSWSLLDIFLVLLAVVATARLYGLRAGALALATLVLLQHELEGFTQLVLIALATVALLRTLPQGLFRNIVTWSQRFVFLLLICGVLPFMVQHIRQAIYPQLNPSWAQYNEQSRAVNGGYAVLGELQEEKAKDAFAGNYRQRAGMHHKEYVAAEGARSQNELSISPGSLPVPSTTDMAVAAAPPPPPPPPALMAPASPMLGEPQQSFNAGIAGKAMRMERHMPRLKSSVSSLASNSAEENYQQYAPDTKVQTGFGNANWRSNAIALSWSGVVDPSVKLKLWLISAHQNLALAVLRVLLMAAFIALLLGRQAIRLKQAFEMRGAAVIVLAVGLTLMTGSPVLAETQDRPEAEVAFPPDALLQELKEKLEQSINEPPVCAPLCATVERTRFSVAGNTLMIFEDVHAAGNVALPLPGGVANWRPSAVMVDDAPATGLRQDGGFLTINLGSGVHHVKMLGALPQARDAIGISLPVVSHYTSGEADGWDIQGIHENGLADNSVQLIRTAKHAATEEKTLERTDIKPFFQLERTFNLAQQWQVSTVVRRITPVDEPAAAHIPLLPGETITTPGVQVKGGEAYANFDAGVGEVAWQSVVTPSAALHLAAPKGKPWVEVWRLTVSNLWHATVSGIPRVYLSDAQAMGMNNYGNPVNFWQWQPWPGESVTVDVTRPVGVEGDTRTLDASDLTITPGERSMELLLSLKIRSSLGGQHEVTLPDGAILMQVQQGGMTLPIQLKQNALSLPLVPGTNLFSIRWKQNDALPAAFTVPAIRHGLARSVNASTVIDVPADRWLLFARGPQVGPAVLFWSWVPVMLILAYALGKFTVTPLRMHHWLLLLFGLNQAALSDNLIVIAWLLALGWRGKNGGLSGKGVLFNGMQVCLALLTIVSLSLLFDSISMGLLGSPDMHVMGGDSYGNHLHWYQDITGAVLPQPVVISLSLWAYRVLMLLWSLWLAFSLVGWLRWGWKSFTEGGYWRAMAFKPQRPDPEPLP